MKQKLTEEKPAVHDIAENWMVDILAHKKEAGLLRTAVACDPDGKYVIRNGENLLNFSSNNYLGFAFEPSIKAASQNAVDQYGTSAGSSRLICGTFSIHEELERQIAAFKGYPSALLFGSGFLANVGVIPALVSRHDTVYADKLSHASIMDGVILSRANLVRFEHNNADHLASLLAQDSGHGKKLIITESVFSMDGDIAPLVEIALIAKEYNAILMVDEAHATGVFGNDGRGIVHSLGLSGQVHVLMGTCSKALGGYGAFAACSSLMREYLVNTARSYIFTTALPPAVVAGISASISLLADGSGAGEGLLEKASYFRRRLIEAALDTCNSSSQIVPVMVGDDKKALAFSEKLREKGVLALAIRPPTVPVGTARIRFSLTALLDEKDLDYCADVAIEAARSLGIIP